MIDYFEIHQKIGIANFEEINMSDDSFANCHFLNLSFLCITNNASTGYGTASMIKNYFTISGIRTDNEGRAIRFDIEDKITV